MSKKVVFSGVMMLVLLISCGTNDLEISVGESSVNETSMPVDVLSEGTIDDPIVLSQGFVEYDESYIGESENTVLFFHQESCPTCKATEASLIETGVPSDMTVLKVDFDASENNDLRVKYGVTMKHTFVLVDAEGELIKKWNGSQDLADIQKQVYGESLPESVMIDDSEDVMMEDKDTMIEHDGTMMKEEVMTDDATSLEGTISEPTELAGIYTDYDASLVGEREDTVLFFHASWCPSCSAADKGINAGVVPDNLTILKVDYDSSTDLRSKYRVVAQHTFVQVNANGDEIKKWVGGTSVEDIVERVQ